MKHEKTFEAISKLKDIEVELHRLKNALEMANRAIDAAVAAEREKCEKVCSAVSNLVGAIESVGIPNVGARKVLNKACEDALKCVDSIRARGNK